MTGDSARLNEFAQDAKAWPFKEARDLAKRFENNFEQFNDAVTDDVKAAGIYAAA